MNRITKRNISENGGLIPIGKAGENMFRTIAIDTSDWASEDAEYRIIYSRPDGITYPAAVMCEGNFVIWTPDAYDTEIAGDGQIEVRAYHGDVIGKSAIFKVKIDESMQANETEPGIARPDWVDDIIDKVVISNMEQTVTSTESEGVNVFTVALTNGESTDFEVRNGAKGEKGDTGEKGADGYTPQRGIDYWTEDDKAETIAAVLQEADSNMDTKLRSYVKRSDFSSGKGVGIVQTTSSSGTTYEPRIFMATTTDIKGLANQYKPIVPANLETAVYYANKELGVATETYVDKAVSAVEEKIPDVSGFATKDEVSTALGDISAALDKIIALQNSFIGGDN